MRKGRPRKIFSMLIALTLLLGVLAPVSQALTGTGSSAESEEELENSLTQNDVWYIGPGETEYLNGTEKDEFVLDESIVIDGGRLEINNATLTLLIDGFHPYNISLENGGELALWNSEIRTTTPDEDIMRPFLKTEISATESSTILLQQGSTFRFPGWVTLEGSDLTVESSSFEALEDIPNYDYTWGYSNMGIEDNSYSPTLSANSGSDVEIIDSEINDNYQAGLDPSEWNPSDLGGNYEIENNEITLLGDEDHHLDITSWVLNNPQFPTPGGEEEYPYMNPYDRISALFLDLFLEYDDEGDVDGEILYGIEGAEEHVFYIDREQNEYADNLFDLETFGSEIEEIGYEGDDFTKDLFVRIDNTGSANITMNLDQQNLWSAFENDMRIQDSTLTVINSYIDVDFLPADVDPRPGESQATAPDTHRIDSNTDHRVIRVYDSEFRAHGIQVEGEPTADGDPPFVEWGASTSGIYRWAHVEAFDSTGELVEGAEITTEPAVPIEQYEAALSYLQENYHGEYLGEGVYETDEEGKVTMILRSDTLNFPEQWPNADYEGNYDLVGEYELDEEVHSTSKQISLSSFPTLSQSSNNPEYQLEFDMEIPLPDLNIVDLTVDGETEPDDLVVNRSVEINLTVSNDGDQGVDDVLVEFRLDDEEIDEDWTQSIDISAGEEVSIAFDWTPEEEHIGTKTLTAEVDPYDEVEERDKEDQSAYIDLNINERPNLTVEEILLEGTFAEGGEVKVGEEVQVSAEVANIGGTSAQNVEVVIFDHEDEVLGTYTIEELIDGDSIQTGSFTWDIPDDPGEYTLSAEVDPQGEIDESDETNNVGYRDVDVLSEQDVQIESFDVIFDSEDDEVFVGQEILIEVTVENVGGWESNEIEIYFYLDYGEDTEEYIGPEPPLMIGTLSGGEVSDTHTLEWTADIHEEYDDEPLQDRNVMVAVREIGEDYSDQDSYDLTVRREINLELHTFSIEPVEVTEGEIVVVTATVENTGAFDINDIVVELYVDGESPEDLEETQIQTLAVGESREIEFEWTAELGGLELSDEGFVDRYLEIRISEASPDLTVEAPSEYGPVRVWSQPDLDIVEYRLFREGDEIDPEGGFDLEEMDTLRLEVHITNTGGTPIDGAEVEASFPDGRVESETLAAEAGETVNVSFEWTVSGTQSEILIRVNSTVGDDAVTYDDAVIDNFDIEPMEVELIDFNIPEDPQPGETYIVDGTLRRESDGKYLASGMEVIIVIEDEHGEEVISYVANIEEEGYFSTPIQIPDEGGEYNVVFEVQNLQRSSLRNPMSVKTEALEVAGLPWWLFLVIAAIAVGGAGSVFAYTKFFGEAEMVECGNCGATISADATRCPKCDVEFDMDTVKCSECDEWIPADSDVCPECGAEFVKTGKEVQDYTERMREQYKKFIRQEKRKAEEELGKELSQKEFMDWWKDQPSFVTFENWLERKEKQRREGSKECPECGSLNSVDAGVCQKCGTSLIDVDVGTENEDEKETEDMLAEEEFDESDEEAEEDESDVFEEDEEQEEPSEAEETKDTESEEVEESSETKKVKKKPKKVKKKPKKRVKKKIVKKSSKDED